jgi:hypothetical protein
VDPLVVAGLACDQAVFRSPALLHAVARRIGVPAVEFAPTAVAEYSGTLTSKQRPRAPVATLALHGAGSETPEIEASTTPLTAPPRPQLHEQAAAPERLLLIRNFGGASAGVDRECLQGSDRGGSLASDIS